MHVHRKENKHLTTKEFLVNEEVVAGNAQGCPRCRSSCGCTLIGGSRWFKQCSTLRILLNKRLSEVSRRDRKLKIAFTKPYQNKRLNSAFIWHTRLAVRKPPQDESAYWILEIIIALYMMVIDSRFRPCFRINFNK